MVGGGMAIAEIRPQPPGLVVYARQSMCGVAWPYAAAGLPDGRARPAIRAWIPDLGQDRCAQRDDAGGWYHSPAETPVAVRARAQRCDLEYGNHHFPAVVGYRGYRHRGAHPQPA